MAVPNGKGVRTWDQNPNDSAWNDTAHSLIGWKFKTNQTAVFYVIVACSDGQERYLMYLTGEGTDSKDCRYLRFYLGSGLTDNTWKSIERDVRADFARFEPGLAVTAINGFALRAGNLYLDDLRLGPAGDAAFQFVEKENGDSASHWAVIYGSASVSAVTDSARHPDGVKKVIRIDGTSGCMVGTGDNDSEQYNPNDTAWNSTKRVLSFWYKGGFSPLSIAVTSSAGARAVYYYSIAGTDHADGNGCVYIYLGTGAAGTTWQRFERNVEADYESCSPYTWQNTDGLGITPTSTLNYDFYIDDIRLSDSRTMKFNSLTGGAIGQIVSVREVTGTGGDGSLGLTDTWLHYDHIGNVMNTSTSAGALGTTYNQDAWGNVLASATTGQWQTAALSSGRHLTTKEYDSDTNLYYFWERWLNPATSQFFAVAPRPRYFEHPYAFVLGNPLSNSDPLGAAAKSEFCAACKDLCDHIKSACALSAPVRLGDEHAFCALAELTCDALCKTIKDSGGHMFCKIDQDACMKRCGTSQDPAECTANCSAFGEKCHALVRKQAGL